MLVEATEVLVIGGGMAGSTAAIAAVRAGMKTTLIRRSYGATALSAGFIDTDRIQDWAQDTLGMDTNGAQQYVDEVMTQFLGVLDKSGYPFKGSRDRKMLLANAMGTVRRANYVSRIAASGDFASLDNASILVVGVRGYVGFDAAYVGKSIRFLAENGLIPVEFTAEHVVIAFPKVKHRSNISSFELAHLLDDEMLASQFAESIRAQVDLNKYTHIAFPAVLGEDNATQVLDIIEDKLGLPSFEVLPLPPSVPGLRLQRALDSAVKEAGVEVVHAKVTEYTASQGWIQHVDAVAKDTWYSVRPRVVILATGKFIGGGIQRKERLMETIFHLPISIDGEYHSDTGMSSLIAEEFVSEQRIFSAGVTVNERLQPIGCDGETVFKNLWAAGAVTTGYSYSSSGGGLGLAMASGYTSALKVRGQLAG